MWACWEGKGAAPCSLLGQAERKHEPCERRACARQSIGAELDLTDKGLGIRSRRYAMLVDDGTARPNPTPFLFSQTRAARPLSGSAPCAPDPAKQGGWPCAADGSAGRGPWRALTRRAGAGRRSRT